jgi:hypothetical protein
MRTKPLKSLDLILSLSKDEAKLSGFFSSLLVSLMSFELPCEVAASWAAIRKAGHERQL